MRKIPATIVTQHPDHAHTPYWHFKPFISTKEEPRELYLSFKDLGATEYKWDWEGKLVDEAILERIFGEYFDYFKKEQIGKNRFITFRLPNTKIETEYRLGRAFMGIIAASGLAKNLGLTHNPLFEVIIPMTTTAQDMYDVQEAFRQIASIRHPLLKRGTEDIDHIEIIPLFEDINTIANSDKILSEYLKKHKKGFKFTPKYIRPYVARSDPALNAGIVPTVLAIKIALSRYRKFEETHEIQLYPIIGAASLPFRGGINPFTIDQFIKEYAGIRTTTIQSSFRYDFPKEAVIEAIQKLEKKLKNYKAPLIPNEHEKRIFKIMQIFTNYYQETIEQIAPIINQIAQYIPRRRERVQHVGLFGYSRGVGEVKLPRAIAFTASLYSIGIPPEIIGTGRGIAHLLRKNMQNDLELIKKYYVNFRSDLLFAMKYVNFDVLSELSKTVTGFKSVYEDAKIIIEYLKANIKLNKEEKEHQELTSLIYKRLKEGKDIMAYIEKAALIRKSLG